MFMKVLFFYIIIIIVMIIIIVITTIIIFFVVSCRLSSVTLGVVTVLHDLAPDGVCGGLLSSRPRCCSKLGTACYY